MMPTRRPGVRWTQDAIVDAILAWCGARGRIPTAKDWVSAGEAHPSSQTVRRIFGDWRCALEQAALRPDARAEQLRRSIATSNLARVPTRRGGVRWTPDLIAYAIRIWCKSHDGPPSIGDWQYAGEEHPCRGTVVRVFGSWRAALEHAGIRPFDLPAA
jgi:hypothetical protein